MSDAQGMRMGYEVFHDDVNSLVEFYVSVLGFTALPADDPELHVVVKRDSVRVGCSRFDSSPGDRAHRRPPAGSEIVLTVPDIATEYERVTAHGWAIADELRMQPWGKRDFRIFDPSGQYLRITQN